MAQLSFDHVVIPVRDLKASRAFYENVLGLELYDAMSGDDWEGYPWLLLHYHLGNGQFVALSHFKGLKAAREKLRSVSMKLTGLER